MPKAVMERIRRLAKDTFGGKTGTNPDTTKEKAATTAIKSHPNDSNPPKSRYPNTSADKGCVNVMARLRIF